MNPADRPATPRALISLPNLRHNLSIVRAQLAPATKLCAVLKANAYGHGAPAIARDLGRPGANRRTLVDAIAVASFDEAEALGSLAVPVHVLRPVENVYVGRERRRLEAAVRAGWVLCISSTAAASDVGRLAASLGVVAPVQVAVDTGMCRAGAALEQVDAVVAAVRAEAGLKLVGFCTHFVNARDLSDPLTPEQIRLFRQATDHHAARDRSLVRHAAATAGVFFWPDSHFDMCRAGGSLFGIDPGLTPTAGRDMRPILKWVAPLLMMRDVKKGTPVGYGPIWHAPRDSRIGLVPIGYADGYSRILSNRTVMMVNGHAAPVVGRMSMDYTTLDLTDVPLPTIGDEVTVIDDDPRSPASVYELAKQAETIPYEVLCRIGSRIPRVAIGGRNTAEIPSRTRAGTDGPAEASVEEGTVAEAAPAQRVM